MADIRELSDKLTTSFAEILYSWQNPPSLNAPSDADLSARQKAMRDYFTFNPMAYHVLKSLVATSINVHEWVNLSIPERRRREVEQEANIQRILRENPALL